MKNNSATVELDRPTIIMAAIVASAVGALFYNLLPLVLGMAQDYRQLQSSQIGFLGSSFFLGYMLSTSSGYFWIRKANWRTLIAIMTPVGALSLVAAAFAGSYSMLVVLFFIAGAALSIIYGVGATLVGDLPNASRWYGVKIASEAFLGAVIMKIFPGTVISWWGFEGLLCGMAAIVVGLMILAYGMPAKGTVEPESVSNNQAMSSVPANRLSLVISLVVLLLFFTGATAAWSFVERLGSEAGFDATIVGNVLSLALVMAVLGSLLLAYIGERFGFFKPFFITALLFLMGFIALYLAIDDVDKYALGACLIMFAVGFGIPIPLATTAKLDHQGRYVILTIPVIGCAAMIAPGAAGLLTEWGGRASLLLFCAILIVLSALFQWWVCRRNNI